MTRSRVRLNLGSVRSIAAAVVIFFGLIVLGGLSPAPASAQEPTGSISGVVTDLDGNPLAGTLVYLFLAVYDPSFVPLTAFTAANGTYSFVDVDAGDYTVQFVSGGAYASEVYDDVHNYDTPTVVTVVAGLATTGIDAALSPMLQITGTVTDTNGDPVPGVRVEPFINGNDYGVIGGSGGSDTDGNYELYLEPGDYQVRFSTEYSEFAEWWAPQWWDDASIRSASTVISLTTDDVTGIDAQMDVAGTVTGTVYDIAGQPVPDGYVQLFDEVGFVSSTFADSNGYYTMDGAGGGPHVIRAGNNPGFGLAGETSVTTVAGQTVTGVDVIIAVPVSVAPDTATTIEDTPVIIDVLANDADTVASTLSISDVPANGTATIVNNTIRYAPAANMNGSDSFDYEVCGLPSDCKTAAVTITITAVNDTPVGSADQWSGNEGEQLTVAAPGVLANDTDVESSTLTAIVAATTKKGTVNLKPDGSFTYTPNAKTCGTDTFTYRANDGALSSSPATVTLDIACKPEYTGDVSDAGSVDDILNASDYTVADADTLRLYRAFLGREPDVEGTKYWITQSRAGANPDDLAWGFGQSTEFKTKYGILNNDQFLTLIYTNMLNRSPDQDGFNYWLGLMNRKIKPLSQDSVVRWVVANNEFINKYPYTPTR